MKKFTLALMVSLMFLVALVAQAEEIRSEETAVNIARVVQVVNLASTPEIQVNVAVQDLGGSTDMSPSQVIYLNLYAKGEMFNTDASFKITHAFGLVSAKRVKGGVYEITVTDFVERQGLVDITYVVDARNAIVEMKNVDCGVDFDCDASENFRSSISVVRK